MSLRGSSGSTSPVAEGKRSISTRRRSPRASPNRATGDAHTPGRFILEDQVGFLVRAVSQRNTELFAQHMIAGLTRVQFSTMVKLQDVGISSQNELGRLLLMDRATIRDVVSRLRKRGFIRVQPDTEDRRQHVLGLTELGETITRRAMKVAPAITENMLKPLNESERKQIVKLLRKIIA
jgi:MarR family transcriptional regulator, lower aerobic nicotinate degradation pathway regulator